MYIIWIIRHIYGLLSLKHSTSKKNCLKQSSGSEDIIDLKINLFRVFFVIGEILQNKYPLIGCSGFVKLVPIDVEWPPHIYNVFIIEIMSMESGVIIGFISEWTSFDRVPRILVYLK